MECFVNYLTKYNSYFLLKNLVHLSHLQFSCSVVSNSVTPWTAARQASLSITSPRSLLKLRHLRAPLFKHTNKSLGRGQMNPHNPETQPHNSTIIQTLPDFYYLLHYSTLYHFSTQVFQSKWHLS